MSNLLAGRTTSFASRTNTIMRRRRWEKCQRRLPLTHEIWSHSMICDGDAHTHTHTSNERYSQSASTNFTAIHCSRTHTRSIHTQKIYGHHRLIVPVAFATHTKTQRDARPSTWTLLKAALTASLQGEVTSYSLQQAATHVLAHRLLQVVCSSGWLLRALFSSHPECSPMQFSTKSCILFIFSPVIMFDNAIESEHIFHAFAVSTCLPSNECLATALLQPQWSMHDNYKTRTRVHFSIVSRTHETIWHFSMLTSRPTGTKVYRILAHQRVLRPLNVTTCEQISIANRNNDISEQEKSPVMKHTLCGELRVAESESILKNRAFACSFRQFWSTTSWFRKTGQWAQNIFFQWSNGRNRHHLMPKLQRFYSLIELLLART